MKRESKTVREQTERTQYREHSVPIYMTSSFVFNDTEHGRKLFAEEIQGNIYSRFSNPNTTELIMKMCSLENMYNGFAVASGMAAVFAGFASVLKSGDHIVSSRALFGSSHQVIKTILPKWGITSTYVDADDKSQWENAIGEKTKMLFVESPSNPGLELVDLEFIRELKQKYNLLLHIDNTFATPILQNPANYGADIISHSTTKYIDGQGRTIGGVILCSEEVFPEVKFFCRQTGPAMSPFNAWILSKSLETLKLRMEKHSENALKIAAELEKRDEIEFVKYPFLPSHPQYKLAKKQMKTGGGILTFDLKGGFHAAKKFVDNLMMCSKTANLGDSRTIVTHPASTTHSKLSDEERSNVGITQGLIRVSVGLEDVEDILNDIIQAIKNEQV